MYNLSVEQLKNIPLFAFIDDAELSLISEKLELESYTENERIIREGDVGDCLYLIKKGQVKVVAAIEHGEEEIVLSFLKTGDHFGEMSLITGESRSASVIAVTDCELWKLSKAIFDTLIMNNPNITLTLTHFLSQRLKSSNLARRNTEEYYKNRFLPHGKIEDIQVVKLLKYAEDNSLSGKLIFENNDDKAILQYKKGQLINLDFADKNEDEAMDTILQWEKGTYRMEPSIYDIMENETAPPETSEKIQAGNYFIQNYLTEKFEEFVRFAGARITQRALNHTYFKFEKYFDFISEFEIHVTPDLKVNLKKITNWTEKHTLLMAIILRDVVNALERDTVGIIFWSPRSKDDTINEFLENLQFFEYYDQAMDVVKS